MLDNEIPLPEMPDFKGKGSARKKAEYKELIDQFNELRLERIHGLHVQALFNDGIQLVINDGVRYQFSLLPGHFWGADYQYQYGPRKKASVMVLGKCLGVDEHETRLNFCGPSAELLREQLYKAGIMMEETDDWYVTNLIRWIPPDSVGGLPKNWIKACRNLLEMELRILRPDYILCLGSDAGKELLGPLGAVGNMTGRVEELPITYRDEDGEYQEHRANVCVITHPAAVLHNPDSLRTLEDGIQFFCKVLRGDSQSRRWEDVDHRLIYDLDTLNAVVDEILASESNRVIACDCEWGRELRSIQFSHRSFFGATVVLRDAQERVVFKEGTEAVKAPLLRLFKSTEDRKVRIGGHFFRSDMHKLLAFGIDVQDEYAPPENFEDVRTEGGWDTSLMSHAVSEADRYGLEVLTARYTTAPPYHIDLMRWLQETKNNSAKAGDELNGYGNVPDEILFGSPGLYYSYTNYDVDVSMRIYETLTRPDGLLDCDQNGQNSWRAYWSSHRGSLAAFEIEEEGLHVDMERATLLQRQFRTLYDTKLDEFRKLICWDDPTNKFSPTSPFHSRELLFGARFNRKKSKNGEIVRLAPEGAMELCLDPIKTTGKRGKAWAKVVSRGEENRYTPSTDGETLGNLRTQSPIASQLADLRTIYTVLSRTLCDPTALSDKDEPALDSDDDSEENYEKGLLSYVGPDKIVRTHIRQTLETARWASRDPNLQNLPNAKQAQYDRINGKPMTPIRSLFCPPPGHVLVETDYTGAELSVIAWESGDPTMIEHTRRNVLPEEHPEHYDIHSQMAVKAFKLSCEPTKAAIAKAGLKHLRIAAKAVVFGANYGRQAEALFREAIEQGALGVTLEDMKALLAQYFELYPGVARFIKDCCAQVHRPGWMMNFAGRIRRFSVTGTMDKTAVADTERQAMNWRIQSGVADAMLQALHNFRQIRRTAGMKFKLALQIHDAVLLSVPYHEVEAVMTTVIPAAMESGVPIVVRDFSGRVRNQGKPYFLSAHREVNVYWGEKPSVEFCRSVGIAERHAAKPTAA